MDALNAYKQPIMVYLPPRAELRGGSWVVIDPTINPSMMEMYSDPTASGGVLEPEAIVEIKYRSKDVRKTMERLDPVIKELMEEMGKSGVGATDKALLEERLKRREEQLAGVYHQVFTLTFSLIRFSLSLSHLSGFHSHFHRQFSFHSHFHRQCITLQISGGRTLCRAARHAGQNEGEGLLAGGCSLGGGSSLLLLAA